jgi:hypothetical protein
MQGPLGSAARWVMMGSGTCDKKLTRIHMLLGTTLSSANRRSKLLSVTKKADLNGLR